MFMSIHESMFVILKQRKLIGIHKGKITILAQVRGSENGTLKRKERKQKWSETEMKRKESNETREFQVQGRLPKVAQDIIK